MINEPKLSSTQLELIGGVRMEIEKHADNILKIKTEKETIEDYSQKDLDYIKSELTIIISKSFQFYLIIGWGNHDIMETFNSFIRESDLMLYDLLDDEWITILGLTEVIRTYEKSQSN